jgi:hypothetical protein
VAAAVVGADSRSSTSTSRRRDDDGAGMGEEVAVVRWAIVFLFDPLLGVHFLGLWINTCIAIPPAQPRRRDTVPPVSTNAHSPASGKPSSWSKGDRPTMGSLAWRREMPRPGIGRPRMREPCRISSLACGRGRCAVRSTGCRPKENFIVERFSFGRRKSAWPAVACRFEFRKSVFTRHNK